MRTILVPLILALAAPGAARADPEPKIDCQNATSTVEMNFCADKEFAIADEALNAAYRKALKRVPAVAVDEMTRFNATSWEKALRNSQRAWVAFRDAECRDHVPMFWTGGTGTTVAVLGCMIEKTRARTKELQENYEAL